MCVFYFYILFSIIFFVEGTYIDVTTMFRVGLYCLAFHKNRISSTALFKTYYAPESNKVLYLKSVLKQQGCNGLQNTSCDVGKHLGKFREYSVKIGNYKKLRMSYGKRRVHSISGRRNDDR